MSKAPLVALVGRHRLASELRELRRRAGLTTTALAGRIDISQSKVSKVENAKSTIPAAEAKSWARACGASAKEAERIAGLARNALSDVVDNRSATRTGLAPVQHEWAALEQLATTIRDYDPLTVPGLLQTAAYTRRLWEIGKFADAEIPSAVAAWVERQSVLYDPGHHFEFVIAEVALRWRVAEPRLYLAQIDRLTTIATLPNVDIRILPLDRELPAWRSHGFTLFEERSDGGDPLCLVETMTAAVTVSEPADLAQYKDAFADLRAAALAGEDALELLRTVRAALPAS